MPFSDDVLSPFAPRNLGKSVPVLRVRRSGTASGRAAPSAVCVSLARPAVGGIGRPGAALGDPPQPRARNPTNRIAVRMPVLPQDHPQQLTAFFGTLFIRPSPCVTPPRACGILVPVSRPP